MPRLSSSPGTGGGASALSGLSDVSLSSPSSGQLLSYNGTSWVNTAGLSGYLPLAGGTMTGGIVWTGNQAGGGLSAANIYRTGNGLVYNEATGRYHEFTIQGTDSLVVQAGSNNSYVPFAFNGTQTPMAATNTFMYRDVNGSLNINVPTGGFLSWYVNAVLYGTLGVNGLALSGSQTLYSGSTPCLYFDGTNLNTNVTTGATFIQRVNGTAQLDFGVKGLRFLTSMTAPASTETTIRYDSTYGLLCQHTATKSFWIQEAGTNCIKVNTNGITLFATNGDTSAVCLFAAASYGVLGTPASGSWYMQAGGTNQFQFGTAGLKFLADHTALGATETGFYRLATNAGIVANVPTGGTFGVSVNGTTRIQVYGAGIKLLSTGAPSTSDRCLTDYSGGSDIGLQAPATGKVIFWNAGNNKLEISSGACNTLQPILWTQTQSSPGASYTSSWRDSAGSLIFNVPTSALVKMTVNDVAQATIDTTGLTFPTAHTAPAGTVYGLYRTANSTYINVPTGKWFTVSVNAVDAVYMDTNGVKLGSAGTVTGGSVMFTNGGNNWALLNGPIGCVLQSNATNIIYAGANFCEHTPPALALTAATTRTVATSATTKSGMVLVINSTSGTSALFYVSNGTPTKIAGDAAIVAGAPGASQVGLELSSTTLRINNGYATSQSIAYHSFLS